MNKKIEDIFGLTQHQRTAQEAPEAEAPAQHEQADAVAQEMGELFNSTYDQGGPDAIVNLCYSGHPEETKASMKEMLAEDPDQTLQAMVQALVADPQACEAWLAFTSELEPEAQQEAGGEPVECEICHQVIPENEMGAHQEHQHPELLEGEQEPEFKAGDSIEPVNPFGMVGSAVLVTGVADGHYLAGYNQTKIGSFSQVHRGYRLCGQSLTPHQARLAQAASEGEHVVKLDGVEKFRGTGNECFQWLQKQVGYSVDHATKYEGWSIEPLSKEGAKQAQRKVALDAATENYFVMYYKAYGAMLTRPLAFRKGASKKTAAINWEDAEKEIGSPGVIAMVNAPELGSIHVRPDYYNEGQFCFLFEPVEGPGSFTQGGYSSLDEAKAAAEAWVSKDQTIGSLGKSEGAAGSPTQNAGKQASGLKCPDCGADLDVRVRKHNASCKQAQEGGGKLVVVYKDGKFWQEFDNFRYAAIKNSPDSEDYTWTVEQKGKQAQGHMPDEMRWKQISENQWELDIPEGTPGSIYFNKDTGDYEWRAGTPGGGDYGYEKDLESAKVKAYRAAIKDKRYD